MLLGWLKHDMTVRCGSSSLWYACYWSFCYLFEPVVELSCSYMKLSHAIGFDDAPFERQHRGNVKVVGSSYAKHTLHAVMTGQIRRDGRNSTDELIRLASEVEHLQLVFLQGIAMAGFNVVDIHRLQQSLDVPVLVVARRPPNLEKIRQALLEHVAGGVHKWQLIRRAGEMEACCGVCVQRAGLSLQQAKQALELHCQTSNIPEPLRTAHLIAGAIARGHSTGQRV